MESVFKSRATNEVTRVLGHISNAELVFGLQMERRRNANWSLTVIFGVVAMCIATGGIVPGLFGTSAPK